MGHNHRIAIVDIEATGPDLTVGDKIIQIGAVIIENNKIIAEHSMYINPEIPIPPHIIKLTGITNETVANAPTIDSVVGLWHKRLADAVLVAHHLPFDLTVLTDLFRQYSLDYSPLAIDTVKLSKILIPTSVAFSLSDLAYNFNVTFENAHNALSDAKFTSWLLNKLAEIYLQNIEAFNKKDIDLIHLLSHDEYFFFEHPNNFLISNVPSYDLLNDKCSELYAMNQNNYDTLIGHWITEELTKHDQLIIESRDLPFSIQTVITLMSTDSTLISVSNEKQLQFFKKLKIDALRRPNNYIDSELINDLIKSEIPWNQQELVVLLGTRFWLKTTKTFDLNELHDELNIMPLLDRYLPTRKLPFECFNKQVKKIHDNKHIVMLHSDLIYNIIHDYLPETFMINRNLIIYQVDRYIDEGLYQLKNQWYFSETFIEWRKIIDYIQYYNDKYFHLKRVSNNINNLILDMSALLDEIETMVLSDNISEGLFEFYLDSKKMKEQEILSNIIQLAKCTESLLQTINHHLPTQVLNKITQHISMMKNLEMINNDNYYVLKGEIIEQKLYHLIIEKRLLIFPESFNQQFINFKKRLYLSDGNIAPYQTFSYYTQLNDSLIDSKLTPQIQLNNLIEVNVPINYLQISNREDNYQVNLFNMLKEVIYDYLNVENHHSLILVVSNDEQIKLISEYLHQAYSELEPVILAEKNKSRISKMYRRALESDQFIMIIKFKHLLELDFIFPNHKVDVFIQRLPFESFDTPKNKAIQDYTDNNILLFENYLLPKMIQQLKITLIEIDCSESINAIYLLDDRVFTKNYSRDIQSTLSNIIQFEIIEDFK